MQLNIFQNFLCVTFGLHLVFAFNKVIVFTDFVIFVLNYYVKFIKSLLLLLFVSIVDI